MLIASWVKAYDELIKEYIHSLRNQFQRVVYDDSFGSIYGMKGIPCQFEIKCEKGTVFYNTGLMFLPYSNFITILGENIQRKHTDSTGRVYTCTTECIVYTVYGIVCS